MRVAAGAAIDEDGNDIRLDESAVVELEGYRPHDRVHICLIYEEVPAGAQSLASSAQCPHQAFALDRHLAMQFHVEVDAAKVDLWLDSHDPQYEQAQHGFDSVHPAGRVRHDTEQCLGLQQQLADRIYLRWATLAGLISQ